MMLPNTDENFRKKAETRLKTIRTRIDTLEKRAGKVEADIEVRYNQKLNQIRGQYAQTKNKLEEMGGTARDAWLDKKNELERAMDVLSEAVESLARQISL